MVLLIEQERIDAYEVNNDWWIMTPLSVPTTYGAITTGYPAIQVTNTSQLVTYAFTLRNSGVVPNHVQIRLKIGGMTVFSTGGAVTLEVDELRTFAGVVYLPVGSYAVLFEGVVSVAAGTMFFLQKIKIGTCGFNDFVGVYAAPYTTAIPVNPVSRVTPIGSILYTTLFIQVFASTASAVTNLENVGETFTNGVSLQVAGAQVSWGTNRFSDATATPFIGAYGVYAQQVPVGASYPVTIAKRNAATVVNVSVFTCPWILPFSINVYDGSTVYAAFPVAPLTFVQGSTLYVNFEPLFLDPFKYFFVGKKRVVSFGDAADYYYYPSGTGVLACAFTYDIPKVELTSVSMYGWGGCINQIGVDAK